MQERFGRIPEIENMRIKREYRLREKGKMPAKAGSFHDSNPKLSLEKIFAQNGVVTPSQVGLELDERRPGEETQLEQNKKMLTEKVKGQQQQGRPKNSKDTKQRKQRQERPRVGKANVAALTDTIFSAKNAITNIRTQLRMNYAAATNKTLDELSCEEMLSLERAAFSVLCELDDLTNFTFDDFSANNSSETDAIFNKLLLHLFQFEEYPTDDIIAENTSMVYSIMTL
jgi:hypothetical protein